MIGGSLYPGESVEKQIYVYNDYSTVSVKLYLSTSDWNPPEAANYITVTWDCEGYELKPLTGVTAAIKLSVSDEITGITSYSINIAIIGIGV